MLENYSRVRLMSDRFQSQGATLFEVGYVIEIYPNGDYEIDFSDTEGITTAQIVAREEDLQVAEGVYEAPASALPANTF